MQQVTQMALKPAFGNAPRFPAKYEVRFTYRDGRFNLHLFAAKYSALKFIEEVIGDRDYHWLDTDRLRVDDVRIESRHLEAIMSHTYTAEEKAWSLPVPYSYYARYIRTREPVGATPDHDARDTKQAPQAASVRSSGRKKRDTVRNASGSTKQPRLRNTDGTTFGIPELAEQFKVDASKIRAALRKSGIEKPAAGWMWPDAALHHDQVNAAIKKFLK